MGRATPPPFVLSSTAVRTHPLVPELRLRTTADPIGLWETSEAAMGRGELAPPFWATPWPGGLALARYLLDHRRVAGGREVVDVAAGSEVVDVAAGSGVVAVAAGLAGGASVAAYDTDELAVGVIELNALLNGVRLAAQRADVREVRVSGPGALVTVGDAFYDRDITAAMLDGLTALARAGAEVLVGDPYRAFVPLDRVEVLATYDVPVDEELESEAVKTTVVGRFR